MERDDKTFDNLMAFVGGGEQDPVKGDTFIGQPVPPMFKLSRREMQCLTLMADGLSNAQIGAELHISDHTAKFHVNSVLNKLGADNRAGAVARALRAGIIK